MTGRMNRRAFIVITSTACVFALLLILTPAFARYKSEYVRGSITIHKWYEEQKNALGQICCAESDGHDYYGPVTFNSDGSVTLVYGHVLPAYMVLTSNNPTGHAVWWYIEGVSGHTDFCFSPGTLG